MVSFGERLEILRKNNELTQSELADIVHLAPSSISMYESNQRDPDTATVIKLANFFKVSTDYLLGRTDIKNHINEFIQIAASTKDDIDLSEVSEHDKKIIKSLIESMKNKKN